MTRHVGAVIFEDSTRLYFIYDDTVDAAMRPLFSAEKAARDSQQAGVLKCNTPDEAGASDEVVTIISDLALEADGGLSLISNFPSRASKKAMWLTGPRSFLEMVYENGATASRTF